MIQSILRYVFKPGRTLQLIIAATFSIATTYAQLPDETISVNNAIAELNATTDTIASQLPEALASIDSVATIEDMSFPCYFFMPVVYHNYDHNIDTTLTITTQFTTQNQDPVMGWVRRGDEIARRMQTLRHSFIYKHPDRVKYNINTLPEAPKRFHAVVDPRNSTIVIEQVEIDPTAAVSEQNIIKPKQINWLHDFKGTIHFSQAYVSPNWYQGGNDNLNMIINGIYNVKLNQAFHPNLLFETTIQYKLAINNAPEDSLRNYSISEDLFQLNSTFGVKAAKKWFYSLAVMFKTQLLNSYTANTNDLRASFMSPGELNLGLGMTYNHKNTKGTFTFDASVSPLSYNMKICTNEKIDETAFDIKEGHTTVSQIGSSGECKLKWQICNNISLSSRLFAFTNYEYVQGDLETTLSFDINRYLTTQIYAHLRYDTSTGRIADTEWHRWQLKEILSFGFSYKFSTI